MADPPLWLFADQLGPHFLDEPGQPELLIEARADALDDVSDIVKVQMEGAATLSVPLTVDVGVGETWVEAQS